MHAERGFTLIEMLVVAILMVVIVAAVAVIFASASRTVADTEAQHNVTNQGRYALERVATDLFGCKAWDGQGQRFILTNGGADHYKGAQDAMRFRAFTVAGSSTGLYEVEYALVALTGPTAPGVPAGYTAGAAGTPPRQIYRLVRRVFVKAAGQSDLVAWTGVPPSMNMLNPPGEEEVCGNVISFNVEYLANNMNYANLQPSPCPAAQPLGDGDLSPVGGTNDTTQAVRIPFVRVTLIVLSDYQERSERVFTRAIAIPVG